MRTLLVAAAAALGTALPAQTHTVSPAHATTAEGNSADSVLWESAAHRFQQIHNDVRGPGFGLRGLGFRRDGVIATNTAARGRTLDLEASVAHADYATAGPTFASNYADAPVRVLDRRIVNLPDLTQNQGAPAPWTIDLPFDRAWTYDGRRDLLWEVRLHSNTAANANYALDAQAGIATARNRILGSGCIATGRTQPMTLNPGLISSVDEFSFQWSGANYPASVPAFVIVDGIDLDLTVPFLCTKLHAAPWVQVVPGTTSAGGIFSIPPARMPMDPAWGGVRLYQQGVALDGGVVVLSHGVESTLGMQPAATRVATVWSYQSGAAIGTKVWYPNGYVVRFTH